MIIIIINNILGSTEEHYNYVNTGFLIQRVTLK